MAGKGPYTDDQKQFVRGEVLAARQRKEQPNVEKIWSAFNERYDSKRELYEIEGLIRLLFSTAPRGRPPATGQKRPGRPPGKKNEQSKQFPPVKPRRGRALTVEEETEIVRLAAKFVREYIDVRTLRREFDELHPSRRGLPDSVFRNALRRGGVNDALARGLRPELAVGKLPEDFLGRAIAERELVRKRRSFNNGEIKRLRAENELLDRQEKVLSETIVGLQALGGSESAVSLAAALAADPDAHA